MNFTYKGRKVEIRKRGNFYYTALIDGHDIELCCTKPNAEKFVKEQVDSEDDAQFWRLPSKQLIDAEEGKE